LLPLFALSLVAVTGAVFIALRPAAEEVESNEAPKVSEHDLEIYIRVYAAMQNDHDLTVERALEPHQIGLDAFRQIERRVQSDQRLTDKARQALLAQAQNRSPFAVAPSPTTGPTDSTPTASARKPKP
jgi:hypothetical protein